jgi:hypothetical protein
MAGSTEPSFISRGEAQAGRGKGQVSAPGDQGLLKGS